jgi:ribosomal protein S18 acetylase RimI-like enzyme
MSTPAVSEGQQPRGTIYAFTPGSDLAPEVVVPDVRFIRFSAPFSSRLADAMAVRDDEIHTRRAMGNTASLALTTNDAIAAFGWVSFDAIRIYELRLEVPIPRGHAYIWDCATLPAYRGRHIFPGLLQFMAEDMRRQGVIQIWAGVAPGNVASIRSFARAGFRLVAKSSLSPGHFDVFPTAAATPDEVATLRALRVSL